MIKRLGAESETSTLLLRTEPKREIDLLFAELYTLFLRAMYHGLFIRLVPNQTSHLYFIRRREIKTAETVLHGPHLPLGVDAMHNQALLSLALNSLPPHVTALALPPLDIGVSCEHRGFAGTVGVRPETAAATWAEVGACVARAGVKKMILYNSHGGNHALAEVVARRLRLDHDMVVVLALNLACFPGGDGCTGSPSTSPSDIFPDDELRWGIHGGALETSVMMHLRPDLVDTTRARRFESSAATVFARGGSTALSTSMSSSSSGCSEEGEGATTTTTTITSPGLLQKHALGFGVKTGWLSQDLNPHGVVGDATDADAERGEKLVEAAAAGLTQLIIELHEADASEWTTKNAPLYPPQGEKK